MLLRGRGGMVMTELPVMIPGLDACAAWGRGKSVHLPHEERRRAGEYLERDHTYIACPMPVASVGGRGYVYVIVDYYEGGAFSNVHSQWKALDGRTPYEMLYSVKLDLVDSCAFVPSSAEREIDARGLWVGLQASAGCVRYLCDVRTQRIQSWIRYVVRPSQPVVGEVFKFSAH